MKPPVCIAIVVILAIGPILVRAASAQVAFNAPATSPRAVTERQGRRRVPLTDVHGVTGKVSRIPSGGRQALSTRSEHPSPGIRGEHARPAA